MLATVNGEQRRPKLTLVVVDLWAFSMALTMVAAKALCMMRRFWPSHRSVAVCLYVMLATN